MKLTGKTVLVTGGARGIGRGIAEQMAREGAAVVVMAATNRKAAQEVRDGIVRAGGKASVALGDVASPEDCGRVVAEAVEAFGSVDILINNAGICPFNDFFSIRPEEWDRVQAVNSSGVFHMSQAAARVMKEQGGGRIINVTSISGKMVTNPRQVAYCTSKAAANMLTRCMAVALAPYGIAVNAVLPGTIPTDINAGVLADAEVMDGILEKTPLGALGTPGDIARACLYFADPENNWVTGTLLVVDGGFAV